LKTSQFGFAWNARRSEEDEELFVEREKECLFWTEIEINLREVTQVTLSF
jgi:hypothetical protein